MTLAKNEELGLRLQGLEQTIVAFTSDKEKNQKRVIELTSLLHNRSVETENEKKTLRKQIDKIEDEMKLA